RLAITPSRHSGAMNCRWSTSISKPRREKSKNSEAVWLARLRTPGGWPLQASKEWPRPFPRARPTARRGLDPRLLGGTPSRGPANGRRVGHVLGGIPIGEIVLRERAAVLELNPPEGQETLVRCAARIADHDAQSAGRIEWILVEPGGRAPRHPPPDERDPGW